MTEKFYHQLDKIVSSKRTAQSLVINESNNLDKFSSLASNSPILQVECLIEDDMVHELTACLMQLTSLNTLDITVRKITDYGMEWLAGFIPKSLSIRSLFLRVNGVSRHGARHIGEALSLNKTLSEFGMECIQCDLLDYTIGSEGATVIARSLAENNIEKLSLIQCGIEDESFESILACLRKSHNLSILNLSRNKLKSSAFTLIGRYLSQIPRLSTLILDSNVQTEHFGIEALFKNLSTNKTLTSLSLKSCQIQATAFSILGEVLVKNSTLRALNIAGNIGLSEEGARMLSRGLENNNSLKILNASYCNLPEDAVVRLMIALKSNSGLRELYLDYNQVRLGALYEITEILGHNTSLTLLSLLGCHIDENAMWLLLQALKTNTTLQVLKLESASSDKLYGLFLEILLKKNKKITELIDAISK